MRIKPDSSVVDSDGNVLFTINASREEIVRYVAFHDELKYLLIRKSGQGDMDRIINAVVAQFG